MQQKHRYSAKTLFLGGLALVLAVGLGALMMTDIPAPVSHIQKELDAQAFLEPKHP